MRQKYQRYYLTANLKNSGSILPTTPCSMDKLKQIESFIAIAQRGSLTAAALNEGVAPAMMGRRMDALEKRLGVKLLVRTTRKLTLTHEGSAFLEDCTRVLADLASAEASVSAGGVKASGHVRITAPGGFGRRHVAPLLPRFLALHPEVSLSLNLSDRIIDMVNEGYDCAVRVGDMPDSSLISVRLADNRRRCVAAPAYLARAGTPQQPPAPRVPDAQLRGEPVTRLGVPHRRRSAVPATTGAAGLFGWPGAARLVPAGTRDRLAQHLGGRGRPARRPPRQRAG
jgi:DNA-binding transcriptional LysR family regulator